MKADLFETDFSDATVVTMYLLPDINLKLRPKILDLRPGTRVVSHAFDMGEWKPDRTETVEGKTAYLWIVPAKVAGVWQLPQGELTLRQDFQMVEGTLKTGDRTVPISDGRLRGDQISFSAGGADYSGRVSGNRIEGSVKGRRHLGQLERHSTRRQSGIIAQKPVAAGSPLHSFISTHQSENKHDCTRFLCVGRF